MTKEELATEVEEKAETYSEAFMAKGVAKASYAKGYIASAEPREKRIAELEAQIEKMKCCGNCEWRVKDVCNGNNTCGLKEWKFDEGRK